MITSREQVQLFIAWNSLNTALFIHRRVASRYIDINIDLYICWLKWSSRSVTRFFLHVPHHSQYYGNLHSHPHYHYTIIVIILLPLLAAGRFILLLGFPSYCWVCIVVSVGSFYWRYGNCLEITKFQVRFHHQCDAFNGGVGVVVVTEVVDLIT
jgi:hypothetical protein